MCDANSMSVCCISVMRGQRKKLLRGGVPTSQDLGIFDYVVGTKFAQQLGLKLRDWDLLTEVERLAYMWLVINEQAIVNGKGMPNYKLVYFEEFCLDPLRMTPRRIRLRRIECWPSDRAFCGLLEHLFWLWLCCSRADLAAVLLVLAQQHECAPEVGESTLERLRRSNVEDHHVVRADDGVTGQADRRGKS